MPALSPRPWLIGLLALSAHGILRLCSNPRQAAQRKTLSGKSVMWHTSARTSFASGGAGSLTSPSAGVIWLHSKYEGGSSFIPCRLGLGAYARVLHRGISLSDIAGARR
ncbi:hypothetical protein BOTBODRAFT_252034 [Botryobasidium botryosum FD-172 SS1]|uniref:Secreted protein n=1 Tax=Botryobasidium botryosum (strain FD-172 SS1) TaxID=930990 RepID=A0A067MYD2_BOTB1|nr:hypothetical protein BOTBODRAFT_252034 [Botryobasidium botryosum FD-172 SS1]